LSNSHPTFARVGSESFFKEVRTRVNRHFKNNQIDKHATSNMVLKTLCMFGVFFATYATIVSGVVTHPVAFVLLWPLMGIGMAGIGLCVMHDANHGAYSSRSWVNKLLGYSMNILGSSAEMWRIQHNQLHHTYTNIHGADEDLNGPPVLRLTPQARHRAVHRGQHIYAWFLYGMATMARVTVREFVQLHAYRKLGIVKGGLEFWGMLLRLVLWKSFHYSFILVVPLLVVDQPGSLIVLAFVLMHFTTGLILSLIFQTAHIMPACVFPMANAKGEIEQSWALHEMQTTTNYATNNRLLTWLVGGLNFQVEHHLFPNICHVHYPAIASIVEATAKEYNVPYHAQPTFGAAIREHGKMLYWLGRPNTATSYPSTN